MPEVRRVERVAVETVAQAEPVVMAAQVVPRAVATVGPVVASGTAALQAAAPVVQAMVAHPAGSRTLQVLGLERGQVGTLTAAPQAAVPRARVATRAPAYQAAMAAPARPAHLLGSQEVGPQVAPVLLVRAAV